MPRTAAVARTPLDLGIHIVVYAIGLVTASLILVPMITLIVLSFSDSAFAAFPPSGFSLRWYQEMWQLPGLVDSLIVSLGVAVACVVVVIALGVPTGIALSLGRFPGSGAVGTIMLSPLTVPTLVVGLALLQVSLLYGTLGPWGNLIVGHAVITLPFVIRNTVAAAHQMNKSVIPAARTLGATNGPIFVEIMWPLIRPGVIVGVIFALLISFDNYTVSMFLQEPGVVPLPVVLYNYTQNVLTPAVMAVSSMLILASAAVLGLMTRLIGLESLAARR